MLMHFESCEVEEECVGFGGETIPFSRAVLVAGDAKNLA